MTEGRDEYGYSEEDIVKNHGNPTWEAIWAVIKRWDIQRKPNAGYSGATGSDVQLIFDAIKDLEEYSLAQFHRANASRKWAETPQATMKPILYLDLDETILWHGYPVHNAKAFFTWCTTHFEVRWLTRWIPNGIMDDYQAKVLAERFAHFHQPIPWQEFQKYNNPMGFERYKDEAVDFDETRPWVWVENALMDTEERSLMARGHYDKYYLTALDIDYALGIHPESIDNAVAQTWKKLAARFNLPM